MAAGADWVQIRDRSLEARELLAFCEAVGAAARAAAAGRSRELRLLVNRRADVALAAGADGVHLGFDGLGPEAARRLGADLEAAPWMVGVSTHSLEEVADAGRTGADYAHLAPVFDPLSKARERPALGPGALAEAAAASGGLRLIAQGGIDAENAPAALRAGAAGVAVTGAVFSATHPGEAAARLRAALDA